MSQHDIRSARRPDPDQVMVDIADYVVDYYVGSPEAYTTARYMLLDSIGCAMLAMKFPECVKHLGPLVPGATLSGGVRVPGTGWELDPVQAAYNIGVQVRWLDFNDTWLAAEWGHPSDNLGAILSTSDYMSRRAERESTKPVTIRDVLTWAIKAHEIQGVYALLNSFNRVGLDHVILVRMASTAVATHILGGGKADIINAVSHSWADNGVLRTYRHAPNAGPRKSWAAGDACRRAVTHALNAMKGCVGYPSVLSAKTWGFYDVAFKGKQFEFDRPFGSYVMENVLFKISFPAEFHAQTAVECAMQLHAQVKDRLDDSGFSLSGGQQQRLCIARTLAMEPDVILLDEPASALDPVSTAAIEDLLFELKKRYTIVIVTHNMQQAARVSDFTAFLESGKLVEFGETDQVFTRPRQKRTEDYVTGRFG